MTIALYVTKIVGLRVLAVLFCLVALAASIDMLENATSILQHHGTGTLGDYLLLRVPLILIWVLPMGILMGSTIAFLTLGARSEMVVLRAAGVNTLRILVLLVPLALLLGVAENLLESRIGPAAEQMLSERFPTVSDAPDLSNGLWLRDWRAVIHFRAGSKDARHLTGVSIYELDAQGGLVDRIDAKTADFTVNGWRLSGVVITGATPQPEKRPEMLWQSHVTPASILGVARRSDLVNTGEARAILAGKVPGGRGASFYAVQIWKRYANFLDPMVMFLFGALASFGLTRSGGGARFVFFAGLGGTGYILVDGIVRSLGEVGAMGPVWAAFLGPSLFMLIGIWAIMVAEE